MDQGSEQARIPRYLLATKGRETAKLLEHLGGASPPREVSSVDELLEGEGRDVEPGWVFLPPDTEPEVIVDLLVRTAALPGEWSPLLLVEDGDGLSAVPFSPGHREALAETLERVDGEGVAPGFSSFRICLTELARIRHDMNNPLTAALAEVQLVLMDIERGSEVEGALQTVEEQLRRIRDMISELTVLRPLHH